MKKYLFISVFMLLTSMHVLAQSTTVRVATPENTPEEAPIFMAGTFNDWQPHDEQYQLLIDADGYYVIVFEIIGHHSFKFTRGGWDKVETNASGQAIANRQFLFGSQDTLTLEIAGWEDILNGGGTSTASENVSILADNFFMPPLNRSRRIWVYLPPDYDNSIKRYSVLYMHDGQNLFDRATAFAGEWAVDESLNELFTQGFEVPIVIGIDNGSAHRIDEYCPWTNSQYGGGEGLEYTNFIKDFLKPYVDSAYRTRTDARHTAIMGSSLGALVSHFAALTYPEVFGNVGLFSPAFWINPQIFETSNYQQLSASQRFYFMAGDKESGRMINDMENAYRILLEHTIPDKNIHLKIVLNGEHNEFLWRTQFKEAIKWLFAETNDNNETITQSEMYPVPSAGNLFFRSVNEKFPNKIEIITLSGQLVMQIEGFETKQLDVSQLQKSVYIVRISYEDQILLRRLAIQ
ncbi:MAG: alpha/beta hydrolase-fold protein [Bacteroidetes bacterium]|nr:alpha/beta hydrolase-fold protein [Bacteroidota bacterium]